MRGRGRPTAYKPEYAEQARKLCEFGATDQEMADFFNVDVRTLYRWKGDHPDFCQAQKVGKDYADTRVERSLYQQAIGYEQEEVKIFMPANAATPVYAPFRAKVAPSATAAIFWLKNRRRDDWREKVLLGSDPENPLPGPSRGKPLSEYTADELVAAIEKMQAEPIITDPEA